MAEKWTNWLKGMPRAQLDPVSILLLSAPAFAFLIWIDAFDLFFEYSRTHDYEIDEIVAFLFFFGFAAIVFSIRRIADLRREMDQRVAAEGEAQRLARHDALTGLPNRRRFLEEFDRPLPSVRAFLTGVVYYETCGDRPCDHPFG
jgi:predicted signal transduction protein with EAL and GGDEF domain